MGCIGSRLAEIASSSGHLRRSRANVFAVLNVDELGRHLQPGKLEVTETDLVLYVSGRQAMLWPLRCLRRYGYDEDLFSFESGRRCPSGPGIYAFKCHRAESLFNLLQSRIQGNQSTLPAVPSTPITPTPANPGNLSPTFDYVNIAENQGIRGTPGSAPEQDHHDTVIRSLSVMNASTALSQSPQDSNLPLYMNVDKSNASNIAKTTSTNTIHSPTSSQTRATVTQTPCNGNSCVNSKPSNSCAEGIVGSAGVGAVSNSVYYTNVDCSVSSTAQAATSSKFINNGNVAAEVNYAELDLETDSKVTTVNSAVFAFNSMTKVSNPKSLRLNAMGSSLGDDRFRSKAKPFSSGAQDDSFLTTSAAFDGKATGSGGPATAGYATIDFDRTAALSVVTRTKIKLDCNEENESSIVRKTRHNSTAL